MKMALAFLLCFIATVSHASSSIVTQVEVGYPNKPSITLNYEQVPRVDSVSQQALDYYQLNTLEVDWYHSSLFELGSDFYLVNAVKAAIQDQLKSSDSQAVYWETLLNYLDAWEFAPRLFSSVDPDVVRISPMKNPRLRGKYYLHLQPVSEQVWLLGHVVNSRSVEWIIRRSAQDYLQGNNLASMSVSDVWVIQPDGKVEKHPIAYWNAKYQPVAPGAIIYVPIPEQPVQGEIGSLHGNLNDTIIELLRNRMPI